jgi:phospholipid/cholesterol/gamma-HCH transport system substrate-binding protein
VIARGEKVRVGLFLIITTAIVVASVFLLAGLTAKPTVTYKILFHESVGGLDEASPVKFQGDKIGKVRSIDIDQRTALPLVTIAVSPEAAITTETYARLEYLSYASGSLYIELSGGAGAPRLHPGSRIPSRPSSFGRVAQSFTRVSEFFDAGMQRQVRSLLADADEAVTATAALVQEGRRSIDRTLAEVEKTLAEARGLVAENRPGVKEIVASIEKSSAALGGIAEEARRRNLAGETGDAVAAVKEAAATHARLTSRLERLLERNEASVDEIFANLRQASRDLAEAAREVRERPSSLLRPAPRGPRTGEE